MICAVLDEVLHDPELGRFWKYRIGEYLVIASIRDEIVTVRVMRVGHRREIYR